MNPIIPAARRGVAAMLATAFIIAAPTLAAAAAATADSARTPVVTVEQTTDGWQLLKDGTPYTINGAGGYGPLTTLAEAGGNSTRTWGVDDATRARLDEAHALGISVCIGIWLGHERHGVDYNDTEFLARQLAHVRESVESLKDHPAVLMWGIGNEMEADGRDGAIWSHIEAAAALTKRLDPTRPTICVTAGIGSDGNKVRAIQDLCPSIDIIGVNTYGGGPTLPERYRAAGGTKPYVVAEFGPIGFWEVERTSWQAAPERSSTEKADYYRQTHAATSEDPLCLGTYAFLWGAKQEATGTWFNMLLATGERTESVDVMERFWTGEEPDNRAPAIQRYGIETPGRGGLATRAVVEPGEPFTVRVNARDPDGDSLRVVWEVQAEAAQYGAGGDREAIPPMMRRAVRRSTNTEATVVISESGAYRVFAFVYDDNGSAGTMNVCVHVGPVPENVER